MAGRITNRIDQPRELDLVGNPILVGGVGSGFEATLEWTIGEGHDEVSGFVTVGGGTGEHGQFQFHADVGGASFRLDRLFVRVVDRDPEDGRERHVVLVSVLYGPRILPGYLGYREYVVEPGDTLWDIAEMTYGDGTLYPRIVRANPTQLLDPDLVLPGQVLRVPVAS